MTQTLNRWLPSLTLACWSAILLSFHLSGRISDFLHPAFRPGVLISGAALLLLAIGLAIAGAGDACCEADACGHSATRPARGKLLGFAVLLLPALLAVSNSRGGFGLVAIQNRGISNAPPALAGKREPFPATKGPENTDGRSGTPEEFIPRTASGAIAASVIDLLYAAQDPSLRGDFEGKTVEMVGQLMAQKGAGSQGGRMKLVRMFMTCCAADAKPIAVLLEPPAGNKPIPELSWVKIVGKPAFPMEDGRTIAVLKADTMAVTEPPEETMLY